MNDFYDGRFNVLIATTIIESGLDIPNVNTIIIYKANMFGLSQLHQLRGRVGRGKIKGYAYLILDPNDKITDNALKRLRAIEANQKIGSGFAIATNDMDIRGSGNMLGEEQSGHIKEIGIELYNQMLVEEVNKVKNGFKSENYDFEPSVKLNIPTSIAEYILDVGERLYFYRKITENGEKILPEVEKMFGKVPNEILNLLEITKIKNICREQKITQLVQNGTIDITFFENKFARPEYLIELIKKGIAKMPKQDVISFFIDEKHLFQEIYRVLDLLK
jgi:transcription-repair coupling factor (superfamily II helicase)